MWNRSLPATMLPPYRYSTVCSHVQSLFAQVLTDPGPGMEFHTDTSSSVEEDFLSTYATHLIPASAQRVTLRIGKRGGRCHNYFGKTR